MAAAKKPFFFFLFRCVFSLATKNVKSESKIALFSIEHHFKIGFPKMKTITVFEKKYLKYTQKT